MRSARQRVLRKSVVMVFAIFVAANLWGNNGVLKYEHNEFESHKRRHLLNDGDSFELSTHVPSSKILESTTALDISEPFTPIEEVIILEPEGNLKTSKSPDIDGSKEKVLEKLPGEEVTKEFNEKVAQNGALDHSETKGEKNNEIDETSSPSGSEPDSSGNDKNIEEDAIRESTQVLKDRQQHEKGKNDGENEETSRKKHKDGRIGKDMIEHKTQQDTVARTHNEHHAVSATSPRPSKGGIGPTLLHKMGAKGQLPQKPLQTSTISPSQSGPTAVPFELECTTPAYHEFPPDLFTDKQRSRGAIIIHLLVIFYMFYAVAVVCDDYFVASLEECCSKLNLSEDVAGATFMAAGSSAPELFTAILGVLVAKGDVGTGTIVGSAVFNVLFVIGLCGIFSNRIVELTWWPLFRDSVFYSCTVIVLIAIIFDSEVTWYESVIMILIYGLYILLMKFNNDVHFWISRRLGIEEEMPQNLAILTQGEKKNYSSYVPFNNEIDECATMPVTARFTLRPPPADESIRNNGPPIGSIYEAALVFMIRRHLRIRPLMRFKMAAFMIIVEYRRLKKESGKLQQAQISIESASEPPKFKGISSMGLTSESNWKSIPTKEEGLIRLLKWLVQAPLLATLHCTIPNCRKDKYKKYFLVTFFTSITWTAIFSYVMVWMVTLVGYTMKIPDSIMGITFLAAGTSVPDAFASLIVARQGQGDMAVSNSLGSNIFDILIGLAIPWFIQTAMVEPGSIATINSRGMVYSVILLFLTIIITIAGIYFSRWQLTLRLGVILITVYVMFIILSILLEYNFLGYVNPPMCQD